MSRLDQYLEAVSKNKNKMNWDAIEQFHDKIKQFKNYVRATGSTKNRDIKSAVYDFGYEHHIDLDDAEIDYIMDTIIPNIKDYE